MEAAFSRRKCLVVALLACTLLLTAAQDEPPAALAAADAPADAATAVEAAAPAVVAAAVDTAGTVAPAAAMPVSDVGTPIVGVFVGATDAEVLLRPGLKALGRSNAPGNQSSLRLGVTAPDTGFAPFTFANGPSPYDQFNMKNLTGQVTMYSCYPGQEGLATITLIIGRQYVEAFWRILRSAKTNQTYVSWEQSWPTYEVSLWRYARSGIPFQPTALPTSACGFVLV